MDEARSVVRLQFQSEDLELLQRAADWPELPNLAMCSAEQISLLARNRGLDFATAVLYDRVLREPKNREFFNRAQTQKFPECDRSVLVGIVPGAFHRDHKNTGANGGRVAQLVKKTGCAVEIVPVDSFGSLQRNGRMILDWLGKQQQARKLVLIGLSKGGADIKTALALPNAAKAFSNVVAWVNLSGLTEGTPLVEWLRNRFWRKLGVRLLLWLRGQKYSVVEELRHDRNGPLLFWPDLPPDLQVVHVLGFPLRRHLAHRWAPRAYERMAALGPNDGGGFLLSDVSRLPGVVFPVWGADHYLRPDWDVETILLRVLAEVLSGRAAVRQANALANQPTMLPAIRSIA